MRVVLDGPLPTWVQGCSEEQLRARLGSGAYARGAAYARERAVMTLALQEQGSQLHATVRGSGQYSYQTVVDAHASRPGGSVDWSGRCSCPVQVDCKHVAAVLLTTRRWLSRSQPAAAPSPWEAQLTELVRPEPAPEARVDTLPALGLQLEVVTPGQQPGDGPRLRVRPVTPGKAGRWIRTGMSWRDLEIGYGRIRLRPEQREVARTLLATSRARQSPYFSPYSDAQVHLDELGRGVWGLLAEAQEAGIALVSNNPGQAVRLATEPAAVVVDVHRPQPQADAEMSVVVRVPGEPDLSAAGLVLMGQPAHGLFVDGPGQLLLAGFDRPLDAGTQRLLDQGALRIPAPDLPRFLSHYYPALRQRVSVESGDGSVELPEVAPPRLALEVRFEPGHRTCLRWAFAYPLAGEPVRVPLDEQAPGVEVTRDRAAEDALLAGLAKLPVPGGWIYSAGRRWPAPETALTGIDTARFVDQSLPVLLGREDVLVDIHGTPADYAETGEAPLIAVSARDSEDAGADWFDLSVDVSVAGQQVPLAALIAALAHDEEHLILDSGTWFRLDRPELQSLRRLIEEARSLQDREATGLRVTPFQAGLWEELVGLGVVEHQSERWSRTVGGLLALETLPRPDPPPGLQATLRPYQLDGYRWLSLLWDHQLGGILADDMGLGKTLQTLAMAARALEQSTWAGRPDRC